MSGSIHYFFVLCVLGFVAYYYRIAFYCLPYCLLRLL